MEKICQIFMVEMTLQDMRENLHLHWGIHGFPSLYCFKSICCWYFSFKNLVSVDSSRVFFLSFLSLILSVSFQFIPFTSSFFRPINMIPCPLKTINKSKKKSLDLVSSLLSIKFLFPQQSNLPERIVNTRGQHMFLSKEPESKYLGIRVYTVSTTTTQVFPYYVKAAKDNM